MTGFWISHLECAIKIYTDRFNSCAAYYGGGTYSRIYRIKKSAVITTEIEKEKKNGHNDDYDRDEVFVIQLLEEPEDITEVLRQKRMIE